MKKALITGISGQDGSYLAEYLYNNGYVVYGVDKSLSKLPSAIKKNILNLYEFDLKKPKLLRDLINETKPDEIYHLAAYHFSSQNDGNSKSSFKTFNAINLLIIDEIIDTLKSNDIKSRIFYASSCQIFGKSTDYPQNEETAHNPESLYAITKSACTHLCRFYRKNYDIYVSVGILYNHESERRPSSFVTTQIAQAAAKAYLGEPVKLILNDLDAKVDWGSAQDYVQAMWLTLQQVHSDDYIIATGIPHSVRDFSNVAFNHVGLNSKDFVFQKALLKENTGSYYLGDSSKIKKLCNWNTTKTFIEIVNSMVDYQVLQLKNSSKKF